MNSPTANPQLLLRTQVRPVTSPFRTQVQSVISPSRVLVTSPARYEVPACLMGCCKIIKDKNKRKERVYDHVMLFHYKIIIRKTITAKIIRFKHSTPC